MLIFRKKSLIQRKLATKENNFFFQSTQKLFLVSLVVKQGPSRHEELIKANDSFR